MKTMIRNPFITSGYVSADYFCDRRFESEQLVREVMNGNNLALVSTRRMGKTGLIRHCFQFPEIKQGYYTFFIDIYDSRSRPFYQSVSMMHLESIPLEEYIRFASMHFKRAGKEIEESAVTTVYQQFEGITWYIQKVLNTLYDMTPEYGVCKVGMVSGAIRQIIDSFRYTYSEILFRLPEKQKELLIAITKEGRAKALTSGTFIKKYKLASASSVQAALKGLLEKDFVTQEMGICQIYDRFLGIWLKENY